MTPTYMQRLCQHNLLLLFMTMIVGCKEIVRRTGGVRLVLDNNACAPTGHARLSYARLPDVRTNEAKRARPTLLATSNRSFLLPLEFTDCKATRRCAVRPPGPQA